MRLLRKLGDFPLRVCDWGVPWLWAAVHRWLDAKTVAGPIEARSAGTWYLLH